MLEKIVSYVSVNRGVREGEEDGVDYIFLPVGEIEKKLENDELMQYVKRNAISYAYPKEPFESIDKLVVLCGASGSGKDSVMNAISKNNSFFKNESVRFLLSVPETLALFNDYAKENNIPINTIYLDVAENERMKRILRGYLLDDENLSSKYELDFSLEIAVNTDLSVLLPFYLENNYAVDILIEKARDRVLRDRDNKTFSEKVDALICQGIDIKVIDGTNIGFDDTQKAIISTIGERDKQEEKTLMSANDIVMLFEELGILDYIIFNAGSDFDFYTKDELADVLTYLPQENILERLLGSKDKNSILYNEEINNRL